MVEKTLVLVIVGLVILVYDVPKLKQTNRKERIVYGVLTLPIIYLGLVYALDLTWPTLNDLIQFFFSNPAHKIVEAIKVPM